MKAHELYKLLGDAIAKGYRDCEVVVTREERTYEIVHFSEYDLGPGMVQIEIE